MTKDFELDTSGYSDLNKTGSAGKSDLNMTGNKSDFNKTGQSILNDLDPKKGDGTGNKNVEEKKVPEQPKNAG